MEVGSLAEVTVVSRMISLAVRLLKMTLLRRSSREDCNTMVSMVDMIP